MIRREMSIPRPVPLPTSLVVQNGSNTRWRTSGSMPGQCRRSRSPRRLRRPTSRAAACPRRPSRRSHCRSGWSTPGSVRRRRHLRGEHWRRTRAPLRCGRVSARAWPGCSRSQLSGRLIARRHLRASPSSAATSGAGEHDPVGVTGDVVADPIGAWECAAEHEQPVRVGFLLLPGGTIYEVIDARAPGDLGLEPHLDVVS